MTGLWNLAILEETVEKGYVMGMQRVKYSSQAAAEEYIANHKRERPRPEVMAHFRAGAARNRRLMELLAA